MTANAVFLEEGLKRFDSASDPSPANTANGGRQRKSQ